MRPVRAKVGPSAHPVAMALPALGDIERNQRCMSVTLTVVFVNRSAEFEALGEWWQASPGGRVALVWGRRRVGKTALLNAFAQDRRTVFHTGAGRPARDELRVLSRAGAGVVTEGVRGASKSPDRETLESYPEGPAAICLPSPTQTCVAGAGDARPVGSARVARSNTLGVYAQSKIIVRLRVAGRSQHGPPARKLRESLPKRMLGQPSSFTLSERGGIND